MLRLPQVRPGRCCSANDFNGLFATDFLGFLPMARLLIDHRQRPCLLETASIFVLAVLRRRLRRRERTAWAIAKSDLRWYPLARGCQNQESHREGRRQERAFVARAL